jgi:NAD(P)-dependent dehydrogenase (short-subunit alcohol dehydrogenase family)
MKARRTALVTGGNRGIGLATVERLAREGAAVVLTARREPDAAAAAAELLGRGVEVRPEALDLADERSVQDCAERLRGAGIHVDVLVNNGAVLHDGDVLTTSSRAFRASFEVNVLGALWTCRAFAPAMLERGYGRIVNVSSGWGAFSEGLDGPASYSITKAALNALTVSLAHTLRGDVKVNACCPGWVRTRMGGADAERSPAEAADTIAWLATLPESGPNGGFFRDRAALEW